MAIKLEKIKQDKKTNKVIFLIKGSDEVFANTIRRMVAEEVPTLAVEDVEIKDNSSALFDEMLALRLGLIPIKTDFKSYRLPKNEDEINEKSAQCTLQIKLKAGKNGYVYAEEAVSADPKCTFVHEKMPVVKLLPKQKVEVTMTAIMGQGKEHVKWAPGWGFYKHEPIIKIGKVEDAEKIAKNSTDGVFTLKSGKLQLNQDKVYESNLLDYYAELDKGIEVQDSENIIFTLEAWGQLSHKEILQKSADMIIEKADQLSALI
tara:strand:- start:621 stop:1403 length:783 start_codon:yes stop_codon:yes gene_type:complete